LANQPRPALIADPRVAFDDSDENLSDNPSNTH
jgi:hypothetical protein